MTLSIAMITMDSVDAQRLADWWAAQLGADVLATNDGWYVMLGGRDLPVGLSFQKVADPTPGKNRLHLDLVTDDLDGEVARLAAAGAAVVEPRTADGFRWVTLTDPDGNQFCVSEPH